MVLDDSSRYYMVWAGEMNVTVVLLGGFDQPHIL